MVVFVCQANSSHRRLSYRSRVVAGDRMAASFGQAASPLGASPIEEAHVPLVHPFDKGPSVLELDGQPKTPAVDCILGLPPIAHENERPSLAGHRQNVRALAVERQARIFADAWVAQGLPGPPNRISHSQPRRIGGPSRYNPT